MTKMRPIYWTIIVVCCLIFILGYMFWIDRRPSNQIIHHVYDRTGVLTDQDAHRLDQFLDAMLKESDVDLRFVFVKGTGSMSIEDLAVQLVEELQIGAKTRDKRGVLLLYDTESKRLKVEAGYGLEGYFPDIFISYLVNRHVKMFFEYGDKSIGLRLLIRLLQYRIREAIIGDDFDPRVMEVISKKSHLSGGAGVSSTMQAEDTKKPFPISRLSEADRNCYIAKNSPIETYNIYMKWISQPIFDPNVDIFTEDSQRYLSSLPISPAYFDFILLCEFGKQYRIIERQDLAILYFTNTPFMSPHLFIKNNGVWRLDIKAEVRNTREVIGGRYSWSYTGSNDSYTRTFADLLINLQGIVRIKDGDNRPLVIRGS